VAFASPFPFIHAETQPTPQRQAIDPTPRATAPQRRFLALYAARDAARTLKAAGYQEVLAVSAADTIQFMKEIQAEVGVWGALMAAFSRFLGTEEVFADIDVNKAEKGAGFLAVYSPRDEHAEKIRDLVTPFEPLTMQWYLPGGVQSLQAGPSPGPQGIHPENT